MTLLPPSPQDPDLVPAHGNCKCACHHTPGIRHIVACCSPDRAFAADPGGGVGPKPTLQGIDPRKQMPEIGKPVLVKSVRQKVFVAATTRWGDTVLWDPEGDTGERDYDTSDIVWWCELPDVNDPV